MYQWLDLYAPYVAVGALVLAVVALIWAIVLGRRLQAMQQSYAELTAGTGGGSLEAVLDEHLHNVRAAGEQASAAQDTTARMQREAQDHLQHLAMVRYNPFSHTGGDQSFVLALADAHGNGVVINSLHARDGTRIYAKPLVAWNSTYTLTEEEEQVIAMAQAKD